MHRHSVVWEDQSVCVCACVCTSLSCYLARLSGSGGSWGFPAAPNTCANDTDVFDVDISPFRRFSFEFKGESPGEVSAQTRVFIQVAVKSEKNS